MIEEIDSCKKKKKEKKKTNKDQVKKCFIHEVKHVREYLNTPLRKILQ